MPDVTLILGALICLQMKHFVFDYLLQPGWMLNGKGSFAKMGGYAHAGAHAAASLPALALTGLDGTAIMTLAAAEAATHYAIDYTKAGVSARHPSGPNTKQFWAVHGADQLAHHLTYAGMLLTAMLLQ